MSSSLRSGWRMKIVSYFLMLVILLTDSSPGPTRSKEISALNAVFKRTTLLLCIYAKCNIIFITRCSNKCLCVKKLRELIIGNVGYYALHKYCGYPVFVKSLDLTLLYLM